MKKLNHLDKYRVPLMGEFIGDEYNGAFLMDILGEKTFFIVSNGDGWEHVSVSHPNKIPTWETMCKVKDLVFEDEETVIQYHPKKSEYVNMHPNCLHMWRPINKSIPTPPKYMVGI